MDLKMVDESVYYLLGQMKFHIPAVGIYYRYKIADLENNLAINIRK